MTQLDVGNARRVDLVAGAATIAALQAGSADGSPVLLVPGYTGSKEDFAPMLDPLGAAGYDVTAIDLPGQFESPGPDDPAASSPDVLARTLLDLAETLGPRVRLVGHSFGGLVARAAVLADPSAFASLVLMSSGPAALGGERRRRIELLGPLLAARGPAGVYAAMQAAAMQAAAMQAADPVTPPELAEFLRVRFLASSPSTLLGMGEALRTEPDRVGALAATGVRTLVLHGVDDDAWPPVLQHDMARRLGASYVVVPAAAHSPAVENPAATISALLDFWRA